MTKIAINGRTRLIGLLGWPVSHSHSPAMHNAAAAALSLNWAYVPLPVPPGMVETAVRGLPALGFRGVNVTVPHKQAVMASLDELTPAAQAIGAVNTIVVETAADGAPRLLGENTDWQGFRADLVDLGVPAAERDCVILGAGGSARAVAYALAQPGGRVHVLARRPAQAQALIAALRPFTPPDTLSAHALTDLDAVLEQVTAPLLVNTTPLGMTPHVDRTPWPEGRPFPTGAFAYDLVYNPADTRWMQQARAANCPAANGLGMLVHQGARAFARWTGVEPDVGVMRRVIE